MASHAQEAHGQDSAAAALQLPDEACRGVCHADVEKPFSGISDAVHRLLPFHVRSPVLVPGEPQAIVQLAALKGQPPLASPSWNRVTNDTSTYLSSLYHSLSFACRGIDG